jgi:hypothetical protein
MKTRHGRAPQRWARSPFAKNGCEPQSKKKGCEPITAPGDSGLGCPAPFPAFPRARRGGGRDLGPVWRRPPRQLGVGGIDEGGMSGPNRRRSSDRPVERVEFRFSNLRAVQVVSYALFPLSSLCIAWRVFRISCEDVKSWLGCNSHCIEDFEAHCDGIKSLWF